MKEVQLYLPLTLLKKLPMHSGWLSTTYIGGADVMAMDKDLIQKMEDIQKLNDTDKSHVFALLDAFLQKTKLQQIIQ